jgi:hypothetical protein
VQIFPENGEKIREIGTDKIEISNGKGAFFCGFFSVFVCFLRFFYVFFPNFDFFLLIFICFFAHFLLIFYYFIYIYTEMVEIGPFSRVFPPFFPDSAVLKWLFAENLIHPALFSASKAENSHFSAENGSKMAENGSKTPQNGSKTPKMAENSAEIDSGLVILIVNHPNPVKMAVSIAKMAGKWLLAPESAENDRKTAENDRKMAENDRKMAENGRKMAENGRKMAENGAKNRRMAVSAAVFSGENGENWTDLLEMRPISRSVFGDF